MNYLRGFMEFVGWLVVVPVGILMLAELTMDGLAWLLRRRRNWFSIGPVGFYLSRIVGNPHGLQLHDGSEWEPIWHRIYWRVEKPRKAVKDGEP